MVVKGVRELHLLQHARRERRLARLVDDEIMASMLLLLVF